MFVITVKFEAKPECVEDFKTAVLLQAHNSVTREEGCQVFDVSVPIGGENEFFLYEVYDDEAAFEEHLKTEHYAEFDAKAQPMVSLKEPRKLQLIFAPRSSSNFGEALHV
ncbi:MAG: putative quinol monooxygenase [Rhodospirillales bacterium]